MKPPPVCDEFGYAGFAVFVLTFFYPQGAYASGAIVAVLCDIVDIVRGDLGAGVATLAVFMIGVSAALGKISAALAVTVAVGIAVIYGASDLAAAMGLPSAC